MKSKRYKLQCCVCKAVFNNDYKTSHERSVHGGRKVHIQTVGAPENPFLASLASKKRKMVPQNAGDDVEVDDEIQSSEHAKLDLIIIETSTSTCSISIEEESTSSDKKFEEDASSKIQDNDAKGENLGYVVVQEQAEKLTELNSKSDHLNQFPDRDEKDDMNIINLDTSEVSSETTSWTLLMGNLGVLIDNLKDCNDIYKKYCKEELVNEKFAAIEIVNATSSVVEMSKNVLKMGNAFLRKLDIKAQSIIIDKSDSSALISHDPGLRPHTITDNQKSYLIQLGPHQPKLASFPSDGKNRFNPQWYKEFEHLEYSTQKDATFCFVCRLFPKVFGKKGKTEDAWINVGVRSWSKMKSYGKEKLGKLQAHFTSQAHKVALSEYCHFLMKKGHIDHLIDKSNRLALIEEQKIEVQNRKTVEILIDTCKTLGSQGLAFRESDSANQGNFVAVVNLISRHNPTLKAWIEDRALRPYRVTYTSPSSQNEMISLIATELKGKIIEEINSSNFFSVMADTTPDMSHKDIMSIVVRTASENGEIRERLLKSVECTDKTGKGMAELILSSLHKEGIDTSKMAFQSYDYASSMSGQFKGVQKYITEEVGHNVPYIPCQDHRTNTALEHACNVNTLIRELFNVLEQLHVFFTSSTKRFSHLKEKLEDIDSALQLVNLSRTRWTARAKSVKALNQCLEKVVDLLQSISNNKIFDTNTRTKAMGLLKKVTTFDFIITLFFMKNIIEKIKILTEILESPNFNVIDSINVIESTAKNIQNISNDTDAMNNLIESAVIFSRKLHIDAENDYERHHRLIAMEMKAFYRKEFKEVIDSLAMGLTENSAALKEIFAPITKIFSFPLNKDNLSIENLTKANKLFPPGYKDHIPDVHVLKSQMEILIDICLEEGHEDFKSSRTPAKTLQDILYHVVKLKDILKQAHKLCIFVITAAYGVASNERSFSQLKIVKSHLRTTMSDERLDSLMLLKCEKELCKGVNPEHLVKRWVQLKKRHIKIKQ